MTEQKDHIEHILQSSDKIQINFAGGFKYPYITTTPLDLGFPGPIKLGELYSKIKKLDCISSKDGNFPAVLDTSFITSISIDQRRMKGRE